MREQLRATISVLLLPLLQRNQQGVEGHCCVKSQLGAPIGKQGAQPQPQSVAVSMLEGGRTLELHL